MSGFEQDDSAVCISEEEKSRIRGCYVFLTENLSPDSLLLILYSKGILSYRQRETIQAGETRWERAERLLEIIMRGSKHAYLTFLAALKDDNQCHIAQKIEESSKIHRRKFTASTTQPLRNDKTRDRIGHRYSNYQQRLKEIHTNSIAKLNKTLNREFGLKKVEGVFYMKLSMAPRELSQARDKEDYVRRTAETFARWEMIPLPDIFDKRLEDTDNPSRVLILAGAGMGKTTVVQKVAFSWATENLWAESIGAVYYFECRRFRKLIADKQKLSLTELLFHMHGPSADDTEKQDIMTSCSEDILLLIDGMDELVGWDEISDGEHILRDANTRVEIPILIDNIMRGNLLPNSKVLFTSRPTDSIELEEFDRVLVALGFGHTSITDCIRTICKGDESKFTLVMEHLQHKTHLYIYCIVPITCVMLGVILLDELTSAEDAKKPRIDRSTQVYIRVVTVVLKRRMTRVPHKRMAIVSSHSETLTKMMALAADGMFEKAGSRILFDDGDIERHAITAEDRQCGLLELTTEYCPYSYTDNERQDVASFLHLSLQEFLAAVCLCLRWDQAVLDLVFRPTEAARFDMVKLYTAGLLGDSMGQQFIKTLDPNQSNECFSKKAEEFVQLMVDSYKQQQDVRQATMSRLQIIRYVAEGRMTTWVPEVEKIILSSSQESKNNLDLSWMPGGLLPHHLWALSFFLESSKATQSLNLMFNNIDDNGMKCLAEGLRINCSVKSIILDGNNIGDEGALDLAHVLTENKQLESIVIDGNKIGDIGCVHLADALRINTTLKLLTPSYNLIGNKGAEAFAALLQTNPKLEHLWIGGNKIGDVGAVALANALASNTNLINIGLAINDITDTGALAFKKVMDDHKSCRCTPVLKHNHYSSAVQEWVDCLE